MKQLMYGILFLYLSTSLGYFYPREFFLDNGLDNLPRTSFMSDSHTILRIISRSVPGDFPCSVWGREWTTRLLYGGLLLTHWGRDKMDAISQTTFSDAFSWMKNAWILLEISLKFVPKVQINNIPALVHIMAWRRPGDKPLSEPMTVC